MTICSGSCGCVPGDAATARFDSTRGLCPCHLFATRIVPSAAIWNCNEYPQNMAKEDSPSSGDSCTCQPTDAHLAGSDFSPYCLARMMKPRNRRPPLISRDIAVILHARGNRNEVRGYKKKLWRGAGEILTECLDGPNGMLDIWGPTGREPLPPMTLLSIS